jgi:hypothetical protein
MTIAERRFWSSGQSLNRTGAGGWPRHAHKHGRVHIMAVAIVRAPNHLERKDNCGVRMKTGWSAGSGSLLK